MECRRCRATIYSGWSFCPHCGIRKRKRGGITWDEKETGCPVCQKPVLPSGIKNHANGMARTEYTQGITTEHVKFCLDNDIGKWKKNIKLSKKGRATSDSYAKNTKKAGWVTAILTMMGR